MYKNLSILKFPVYLQ